MSPFGARGGNSGIQDSDNLGWKLALVLEGKAPERLLDTYTEERRPAAQHNIQTTKRAARFLAPVNAAERAIRGAVLGLSKEFPFARALVNGGRMSVAYAYDGMSTFGPGGGPAAINPRIRLPNGQKGYLFDLTRNGAQFLGLYFAGKSAGAWRAIEKLNGGAPPLQSYRVGSAKGDVGDVDGWLARTFDAKPGTFVLLRPDQHIAAILPKANAGSVQRMLRKALGYPTNR
jgi:3-(3-hydroxy-phenyl)propionate hydroxylase